MIADKDIAIGLDFGVGRFGGLSEAHARLCVFTQNRYWNVVTCFMASDDRTRKSPCSASLVVHTPRELLRKWFVKLVMI